MNARPSIFLPASEEALLIVSRWQRQSLEVAMSKLIQDAPEAGKEIEDAAPEAPEPYVLSHRQEAAEYYADEYELDRSMGREE